jgi:hypothetical protein
MKRISLIISFWSCLTISRVSVAIFLGWSTGVFAWGEVDFENFSNTLIYTNSVHNGPATGLITGTPGVVNPFSAGSYVFGLFTAPTNQTTVDATLSEWSLVGSYGVNIATPGLMNGNEDANSPGTWSSILMSGYAANFVVVGWSSNVGWSVSNPSENWGNASAWWNKGNPTNGVTGWFGISSIAQDVVVGGGPYPIPTIFGPTAGYEIQGFTLNKYDAIPEPSSFALAVWGIAALVAICLRRFGNAPSAQFDNGTLKKQVQRIKHVN